MDRCYRATTLKNIASLRVFTESPAPRDCSAYSAISIIASPIISTKLATKFISVSNESLNVITVAFCSSNACVSSSDAPVASLYLVASSCSPVSSAFWSTAAWSDVSIPFLAADAFFNASHF